MIECKSTLDVQQQAHPHFEPTTILVTASPAIGEKADWEQALGDLIRWRDSDERRECVSRLGLFESKPADIQHVTGLETWFDLSHHDEPHEIVSPPKYKMALIVWLAVYLAVVPLINILWP
jgi:antibiotic biosynthesis monooxygenase (ABM) superfamily enzyme